MHPIQQLKEFILSNNALPRNTNRNKHKANTALSLFGQKDKGECHLAVTGEGKPSNNG
jgi:hypothetical protein